MKLSSISTLRYKLPVLFVFSLGLSMPTLAQQQFSLPAKQIQDKANGVLALMAYSVVPDLTTSFLTIGGGETEKTDMSMTQVAGGATISKDVPLYLEGGAAYMRYNPKFVASNGTNTETVGLKWNSLALTGGVGWDFPLTDHLVLRPIFNFAVGRVASDATLAARYLEFRTNSTWDFVNNGHLDAYGLGGSLMLDYELVKPEYEIDFETRYTNIKLHTFGGSSSGVNASADAEALSLYSRYRAPTGLMALDRPLRYVLEGAHTQYLGDQRGLLGFNYMNSLGVGLEVDSSAHDVFVTRTRFVARYAFGNNVHGYGLGIAMSF